MFPVKELFLEDVLELTEYPITGDEASCPGAGERQKEEKLKRDYIVEAFKVQSCEHLLAYLLHLKCHCEP